MITLSKAVFLMSKAPVIGARPLIKKKPLRIIGGKGQGKILIKRVFEEVENFPFTIDYIR